MKSVELQKDLKIGDIIIDVYDDTYYEFLGYIDGCSKPNVFFSEYSFCKICKGKYKLKKIGTTNIIEKCGDHKGNSYLQKTYFSDMFITEEEFKI